VVNEPESEPPLGSSPDATSGGDERAAPVKEGGGAAEPAAVDPFAAARRRFVMACAGIAGGLAVAGTLDRTSGGVIVLAGWVFGILALHRLGRAGSQPRPG
jgi:hypothetical protein